MPSPRLRIAFVGGTGFPNTISAEINRLKLLSKGLTENDCWILVINRRGYCSDKRMPITGHVNNILYTHASGNSMRSDNFFLRNSLKVYGVLNEILILKKRKINAIIINTRSFGTILIYWLFRRICRYKMFFNYTELNSAVNSRRKSLIKVINDLFFEKYAFRLLNGVIPISDLLKDVALNANPGLPYLKIPVLVDFNEFSVERNPTQSYFVYCGHSSYHYAIEFILQSFELISSKTIGLKLVLYGDERQTEKVRYRINSSIIKERTEILSDLVYSDLIRLYINSTGLLIPLKPDLRDKARFPHKIGEYAASGRPIISTKFGEINNYFTDGVNALITEEFDCKMFARKMDFAFENPDQCELLGIKANETARKYFDYKINGEILTQFIWKEVVG